MSRYCGPRLRIIRRLGDLPGLTKKTTKLQAPPGQHGATKKNNKMSQYNTRLVEKQRLRFNYGITEKKLLSYVKKAARSQNSTGDVLLQLLEMRLDNIVFRLGFAPSIAAARQIINHRQVLVNDKSVNIASYECKPKDIIALSINKSKETSEKLGIKIPPHLQLDTNSTGQVLNIIDRQHIGVNLNERLIIEFYSRKV